VLTYPRRYNSCMATASAPWRTSVCIVGCGPAGAVLGYLLARAGIEVVVLEKHADFLRDFRGDTIHPSTLEILDELGLAERFLELPHSRMPGVVFEMPGERNLELSFKRLRTRFPYIAFVPQWDFLNFLTAEAARYPTFTLQMQADAYDLILENNQVNGVRYRSEHNTLGEIRAALTVGADGRTSVTRATAGLPLVESSPAMDVLWFRLSRRSDEPEVLKLKLMPRRFALAINRRDYWQVAWVIAKGEFDHVQGGGLDAFRRAVASALPQLADRVGELRDWEQIKLLTVRADRLTRWYRHGYLAIGDAAHAMSPVGGVGINVAIQDAVVAANLLWRPLREGRLSVRDLKRVQVRRELSVRLIQAFQSTLQNRVVMRTLRGDDAVAVPRQLPTILRMPILRDIPPRLIAFGFLRPHVRSPELAHAHTRGAGQYAHSAGVDARRHTGSSPG
jgi:2-polyprenyl-6-methoxyphenol hydroxylase-like FAD-dependent oxidoreductase